jgi:hypothetical protein
MDLEVDSREKQIFHFLKRIDKLEKQINTLEKTRRDICCGNCLDYNFFNNCYYCEKNICYTCVLKNEKMYYCRKKY